mgnify:CR=1 FL=1
MQAQGEIHSGCCGGGAISRRELFGASAGVGLAARVWATPAGGERQPAMRQPLTVQPVLVY